MVLRIPCPISWTPSEIETPPSSVTRSRATAGTMLAGYAPAATPKPISVPSAARIEPGSPLRRSQPKRSAPRRRQATRWRDENGFPEIGIGCGIVRDP